MEAKRELVGKTTFDSSAVFIAKISDIYIMQYICSSLVNSISCEDRECSLPDNSAAITEWFMKSESGYLTMYKNDNVPLCLGIMEAD